MKKFLIISLVALTTLSHAADLSDHEATNIEIPKGLAECNENELTQAVYYITQESTHPNVMEKNLGRDHYERMKRQFPGVRFFKFSDPTAHQYKNYDRELINLSRRFWGQLPYRMSEAREYPENEECVLM